MDNITLDSTSTISVDRVLFHKMSFIYNALQSGWEVKMTNDKYSFKKKHNKNSIRRKCRYCRHTVQYSPVSTAGISGCSDR